ncbi:MAG: hypothetical protein HEQ23_01135 [Tepidisphaera sp.]|jgi:eukaryotic-like serine/threonine-protein kinase
MPQRDNSFTKAFLPGLILGIVVGGFAGAYLTGAGGETIQPKAVNGQPAPQRPRDAMEAPPANEQVPVIDQGAAPANNPANNPANPPANNPGSPPAETPNTPPVDPKAPAANPPANTPGDTTGGTPSKPVEPK